MDCTHLYLISICFFNRYYFKFTYNIIRILFLLILLSVNVLTPLTHRQLVSASEYDYKFKTTTDINSDCLTMSHDRLTKAAHLKYNTIYKDSLKKYEINYYYINNISAKKSVYIKCISGNILASDIQLFDSTNKEVYVTFSQEDSCLYVNMQKIMSKISDTSRIYMTIGTSKNCSIKIICTNTNPDNKTITKSKDKKNNSNAKATDNNSHSKPNKNNNKPKATDNNNNSKRNKNNNSKKATDNSNSKSDNNINKKASNNNSNPKRNKNNSNTQNVTHKTTANKVTNKHNNSSKNKTNKITNKRNNSSKNKTNKTTHKRSNLSKNKMFFVTLSHKFILLKKGECFNLKYTLKPAAKANIKTLWSSSNNGIASVFNGKIKAIRSGIAIIKLSVTHNGISKTASCTIRVTKE